MIVYTCKCTLRARKLHFLQILEYDGIVSCTVSPFVHTTEYRVHTTQYSVHTTEYSVLTMEYRVHTTE